VVGSMSVPHPFQVIHHISIFPCRKDCPSSHKRSLEPFSYFFHNLSRLSGIEINILGFFIRKVLEREISHFYMDLSKIKK
jgi:hypothetical protein